MPLTISTRNARFQQWEALLHNRSKRHRAGEFLVQGVRPVTLAVEHGWPIHALLHRSGCGLSQWAQDLIDSLNTLHVAMAGDLLEELGEKDAAPELVAVVGQRPDDLSRIPAGGLVVVFDRPTSPGNLGTLIRSADALGAAGVIVTGHAADVYDPKTVRASTGSRFSVPVVRTDSVPSVPAGSLVVGLDEGGPTELAEVDLTGSVMLVVGNETRGISAGWRSACDVVAHIPISGAASSLNAAAAASIALYEAARQRSRPG